MPRRMSRTLERVEQACRQAQDSKSLRVDVLREIGAAVPFDAHVWLLTDPVSGVGTSPVATVPGLDWSRLPDLVRLRYLTGESRWTAMRDRGLHVEARSSGTYDDVTTGEPSWRSMMGGIGFSEVATVAFFDTFGVWAWLDLWRADGGPFSEPERDLLGALEPWVTRAVRRTQGRSFAQAPATSLVGPAVLMLGPDLHVRAGTDPATERLLLLNPPDPATDATARVPVVPAAAYNVGAQLLAREAGLDAGPARSRVHVGHGRWLSLSAARLAGPGAEEQIAVTIEETPPDGRREMLSLCCGLTAREDEVLRLVSGGRDTRAVARTLSISEHTVNDHAKAVLAKTGAPGRHTLLSWVAGSGGGPG